MRRTRGFSLVELMVSCALFGLIAAGSLTLVTSAARSQGHSTRVDVAQSGLRAGMDFVTRDVLSVSAGARSASIMNGATAVPIVPIVVTNLATGPDTLDLYLIDATAMANVLTTVTGVSTDITVDTVTPFKVGDIIQLSDLSTAVLSTVTGFGMSAAAPGYPTLVINNPNAYPVGTVAYLAGSYVFRSRHVTYAVNQTNVSANRNESMLTMDLHDGNGAQPLAEGVEDFQVALGYDNNGDGIITELAGVAGDDEWVFNVAGEAMPLLGLANLKVIRVTIVAKSTQIESGTFPLRPAAEDHPAAVAADGFFRRVMRSEITVRNFNL